MSRKQTEDHCAVVSLDNDARNIRGNRIEDHNGPHPNRIPEKENWTTSHHDPVREFTSSCFGDESAEIHRIARPQLISRKCTAHPPSAIRQHRLPPAYAKPLAIEVCFALRHSVYRAATHEALRRQSSDAPRNAELDDRPATNVRQDDGPSHTSRPRQRTCLPASRIHSDCPKTVK